MLSGGPPSSRRPCPSRWQPKPATSRRVRKFGHGSFAGDPRCTVSHASAAERRAEGFLVPLVRAANVTRCGASRPRARILVMVSEAGPSRARARRDPRAAFCGGARATQTLGACRRWSLGRKAPDSNRNRWLSGHFPLLASLPSVHDSSRGFATNGSRLARVKVVKTLIPGSKRSGSVVTSRQIRDDSGPLRARSWLGLLLRLLG
jgi:hypothetical protein